MQNLTINQHITLKKTHACGNNEWKVLRVGVDYKLQCVGCNHIIMVESGALQKRIKKAL